MNALLFLVRKQLKNNILQTIRRPARLVTYLAGVAFMVWMFVSASQNPRKADMADIRLLEGIFLIWLVFLGLPMILSSLKNGASFFKMSDVNLLFVSPVSPKKILTYGLVKQMGGMFFSFFFMVFYSGTLVQNFGITPSGVLLLIVGTALFMILMQEMSLILYSLVNGREGRKRAVRGVAFALIALLLALIACLFLQKGGTWDALLSAVSSPATDWFPAVGWMKGAVFALIAGNGWEAAQFSAPLAALFVFLLLAFLKINPDYYEDVMERAEASFEVSQAVKGRQPVRVRHKRATHVGRTGIGKGWGANAVFYKQLCEIRRKSRFTFFSLSTLALLAINAGMFALISIIGGNQNDPLPADVILGISLAVSVYILLFMNASGEWSGELSRHYIYLIPENSFSKLIWSSMTAVLKPAFDGLVVYFGVGLFTGAGLEIAAACALVYASFGFLYTASNVAAKRIFGGVANRGIVLLLYFALLILLIAPGIIGAVWVYGIQEPSVGSFIPAACGLPIAGWNILISILLLYACRNLLGTAEQN